MAWIRTSIAMIGFGFGVGKITEAPEKADSKIVTDSISSGLIFGEAFIALGVFGLFAADLDAVIALFPIEGLSHLPGEGQ